MKKILVTGGAGFIGINLIKKLLNANNNIFLLTEPNCDLWRIQNIKNLININEINLLDFDNINKYIENIKPDIIYHLASFGGFPNQNDQKLIYDINLYSTINLLNICKKVGFETFINTGSSSEYGIKNLPMKESDFLEPISDYGVSKAASTNFCLKEALFNNLPVYTVRPFSVYGDYELFSRLIPSIAINSLFDLPINLSSKTNVRDFIYVQDIVDLYIRIAQTKPQNNYIFNAGSGVQTSIEGLVNIFEKVLNKKLKINWGVTQVRPWEPEKWQANIELSKNILDWSPKYNLSEGIKSTISWFEKNINFYKSNISPMPFCYFKNI